MEGSVLITGRDLDPIALSAVARGRAPVDIDPGARSRIEAAQRVVADAALNGRPVYGVTTGLGSRVIDPVNGAESAAFSLRTLRSRAMAVGEPLPTELCRAAMTVRLNGLCAGGAGAGVGVADGLAGLSDRPRTGRNPA